MPSSSTPKTLPVEIVMHIIQHLDNFCFGELLQELDLICCQVLSQNPSRKDIKVSLWLKVFNIHTEYQTQMYTLGNVCPFFHEEVTRIVENHRMKLEKDVEEIERAAGNYVSKSSRGRGRRHAVPIFARNFIIRDLCACRAALMEMQMVLAGLGKTAGYSI